MRNISITWRSSLWHFLWKQLLRIKITITVSLPPKINSQNWRKWKQHTEVPTSLASTSVLSKPVCSGGEERSEGVERSVTIIPHMGGQESRWEQEKCKKFDNPTRRRSIADYAFPELHPDTALRKSSRNLLIYTRTRCLELVHPFNIGQEVIQKNLLRDVWVLSWDLVNLLARILRVGERVLPSLFFLQGDQ